MSRVVSVWLPRLATDRLHRLRRRPAAPASPVSRSRPDPGAPLVTALPLRGGLRVAAVDARAEAAGIVPGLPLADARALVPGIAVAPGDPAADAAALAGLADWCGRYSPWTACDPAAGDGGGGGLWLDVSGCAHLFGGEEALLADLAARLEGLGYAARAALADGPGAAWALARFAARPGRVAAPGEARAALSGLPVAALRLPAETAAALERLGLETVGDLEAAPRASLAARFGDAPGTRLDQAMGRRPEPISPRRPAPAARARAVFAEPIGRLDDVRRAARRLVEEVCADLGRRRQGARRLALALYRVDGTAATVAVGTARPVRDPRHLERLLDDRLDGLDFGFGADAMALSVTRAERLGAAQLSLAMPGPPPTVMPRPRIKSGGVPGTHVPPPARPLPAHTAMPQDVDGRDKPGHDDVGSREQETKSSFSSACSLPDRPARGARRRRGGRGRPGVLSPDTAMVLERRRPPTASGPHLRP